MNVEEYVKQKVKPIFEKVANETPKNHMMVGSVGSDDYFFFFQPHNLRHYVDYDKRSFDPTSGGSVCRVKLLNNGREFFVKDFFNCNITVKKSQIQIKNNIDFKKWYRLDLRNKGEDHINIHVSKVLESFSVLKEFIKVFGGKSDFKILNVSSEDKFRSESFIDSIPIKARFHTEVSKKVYNEPNVEMPPSFAANYLTNQAALMDGFDIFKWCEDNINCLDDVFKLNKTISLMSYENRLVLSDYLFAINDRLNG